MKSYIYTCVIKSSGIPIQDIAYSRQEARQMKSLYEGIYNGKVNILRYENPAKIR